MRIRRDATPDTQQGAHKFSRILVREMTARGHEFFDWDSDERCDVSMVRGGISKGKLERTKSLDKAFVVTYGGWNLSSDNSLRELRNSISQADGVVFNSEWGRLSVRGLMETNNDVVIHNGTEFDPDLVSKGTGPVMVCCDRYDIPSKDRALKVAVEAVKGTGRDLVVLGKAPQRHDWIDYRGHISDHRTLMEIRQEAGVVVHLVEDDQCPNTIVEARSQGIPVVCLQRSGVPEIMGPDSISIYSMNPGVVRVAIDMASSKKDNVAERVADFMDNLEIGVIASKYEDFMRRLL